MEIQINGNEKIGEKSKENIQKMAGKNFQDKLKITPQVKEMLELQRDKTQRKLLKAHSKTTKI